MKLARLQFAFGCLFLFFCAGCRCCCKPALCADSTYGLPTHVDADVVLRGNWLATPLGDGTFGLNIRISGGPVNQEAGSVRIWVMDEDFDPHSTTSGFDPNTTPTTVAAMVDFPWSLCVWRLSYDESTSARSIYVLVECCGEEYEGLVTVPSKINAELFEYLNHMSTTAQSFQPDVTGKVGFKNPTPPSPNQVVFDLDGVGDGLHVNYDISSSSGETFNEVWIWRYTPDRPGGWPVPPVIEQLHGDNFLATSGVYIEDIEFSDNELNGRSIEGDEVWLYSIVAVDDGSPAIKYWQYKTRNSVTADPAPPPYTDYQWKRKLNPTGIKPR